MSTGYILRSVQLDKEKYTHPNVDTVKLGLGWLLWGQDHGEPKDRGSLPWGKWNLNRMWETFWYIGGRVGPNGENMAVNGAVLGCVVDILETETLCAFRSHALNPGCRLCVCRDLQWCQPAEEQGEGVRVDRHLYFPCMASSIFTHLLLLTSYEPHITVSVFKRGNWGWERLICLSRSLLSRTAQPPETLRYAESLIPFFFKDSKESGKVQ